MKRFYRSSDEKVVAGVCAGLARYFDLNLVGLRWVVALVTLFASGIPAILYAMAKGKFKPAEGGFTMDRGKVCKDY